MITLLVILLLALFLVLFLYNVPVGRGAEGRERGDRKGRERELGGEEAVGCDSAVGLLIKTVIRASRALTSQLHRFCVFAPVPPYLDSLHQKICNLKMAVFI